MNDTAEIEFPPIDAAPPSPQTAVAVAAAQALDLEKMDLNAIVRSGFQPARDKAAEAVKTLTGVVHDLSTQAAVDKAKTLRHRLIGQPLADVRKLTKGIKSRLAAASRVAGEEEDKAVAAFNAADALITPQIEAREAELEAERQAKAQAEAERKQRHAANLQRLTGAALRAREKGADSSEIAAGIAAMEVYEVTDAWEEYVGLAEAARLSAIDDLRQLHTLTKAREEQAAENERLRLLAEAQAAELERLRKAEAERQEIEAARQRAEAQEAAAAAAGSVNGKAETPGPCEPDTAPITTNSQESGSPADAPAPGDAPGMCAGSDPEASNGSVTASDEGPVAQEVLRAADPAKEYTEGPGLRQVLKAEAATPDATAREIPADASPRGGAMGAGQPAAAGPAGDHFPDAGNMVAPDSEMTAAWNLPTGPVRLSDLRGMVPVGQRIIFAEPEPEDELRTQTTAFVALVLTAFDTKFPSQPKMPPEWWAKVREAGETLKVQLGEDA